MKQRKVQLDKSLRSVKVEVTEEQLAQTKLLMDYHEGVLPIDEEIRVKQKIDSDESFRKDYESVAMFLDPIPEEEARKIKEQTLWFEPWARKYFEELKAKDN